MTQPEMSPDPREREEQDDSRPRITDKRRIDPETGALRTTADPRQGDPAVAAGTPAGEQPAGEGSGDQSGDQVADLERQLAERTEDLQRVTADFANFRRRVDRDRAAVGEQALASVLVGLLPVLDDVERARAHGELVGGFQKVAEGLETTLTKLGLQPYGEPGEPFDPNVHEALMHSLSPDVAETTCIEVLQRGYRIGERIIRPARVAVAEPGEPDLVAEGDD